MTKILVVDDSAFMRKILTGILQKAGYNEVCEASDGDEAVDVFLQQKPDVTLLDIIMPHSGIEALSEILSKSAAAKVIMITAVGQEGIMKETMDIGAIDYIIKPFREEKVIAAVRRALS
ncbi:MAG TPA: response regulator [Candidatus Diapherotrites archaeon]|uniref:Response regulator n=1 Tax=Candidatus Iainarchaeum sp. TaxID=3101447 RepID=A0A7J4IV62_9ARCH|nr:response regulator [Candidatus Diapherotrites archaeon]